MRKLRCEEGSNVLNATQLESGRAVTQAQFQMTPKPGGFVPHYHPLPFRHWCRLISASHPKWPLAPAFLLCHWFSVKVSREVGWGHWSRCRTTVISSDRPPCPNPTKEPKSCGKRSFAISSCYNFHAWYFSAKFMNLKDKTKDYACIVWA